MHYFYLGPYDEHPYAVVPPGKPANDLHITIPFAFSPPGVSNPSLQLLLMMAGGF